MPKISHIDKEFATIIHYITGQSREKKKRKKKTEETKNAFTKSENLEFSNGILKLRPNIKDYAVRTQITSLILMNGILETI